jgi:hypothetical protein
MDPSDAISIIALAVSLVAGAIATWVGYRGTQRDYVATTYVNAHSMLLEVDRLLVEFPSFRPYLYEGKRSVATDPEHERRLAAATMILDIAEYIWERRDDIRKNEDRQAWRLWLLSLFATSPLLAELYARHPEWYPNLSTLHRDASVEE